MRTEETLELRRTLGVLRRWAWLIAACTLLALVIALVVTALMPDTYEATTTLLVAAEQTGMSEYSTLMAGQMLALTYDQMLKSQSTLETVISRLGLDKTPEALAASIKTETVQNTQLIRVTARDTSPQRAALIANTVAEIFIEYAKALPEGRYREYMSNMEAKIEAQRKEIDET